LLRYVQAIFYWNLATRHLTRYFEIHPGRRPPVPLSAAIVAGHKIALSDGQAAQIKEIFDMFDTDGGGTIDRRELDFAMVALGFQKKGSGSKKQMEVLDSIVSDGQVTLEEFSALMTGELSGRDPAETLGSMFAVLSGGSKRITLGSLNVACRAYAVSVITLSIS
jgi:hypothetical protein